MKVVPLSSAKNILALVLVAAVAAFLFHRQIKAPRLAVLSVAYLAFVLVLQSHRVLLGALHCIGFGILLVIAWRIDNTAGLLPVVYTVLYAFSVYDFVAVLIRSRRESARVAGGHET